MSSARELIAVIDGPLSPASFVGLAHIRSIHAVLFSLSVLLMTFKLSLRRRRRRRHCVETAEHLITSLNPYML